MQIRRQKSLAFWSCVFLCAGVQAETVMADFNDLNRGRLDVKQESGNGQGFRADGWQASTSCIKTVRKDLQAPSGSGYSIVQTGTPLSVQGVHDTEDRRQVREVNPLQGESPVWFSFLVKNEEPTDIAGIDFRNDQVPRPEKGVEKIYLEGSALVVEGRGGGRRDLSSKVSLGKPALVVGKLTLGSANSVSIWVNPVLSSEDGLTAIPADFSSENVQWRLSSIQTLGLLSYDSGPSGIGGILDSVRLSNEANAFSVVTGIQ